MAKVVLKPDGRMNVYPDSFPMFGGEIVIAEASNARTLVMLLADMSETGADFTCFLPARAAVMNSLPELHALGRSFGAALMQRMEGSLS